MSTVNFDYKLLPNGIKRPLIQVEITKARNTDGVPCLVLVDSGADCCILNAKIGEILGIDIKSGQEFPFQGVSGKPALGYIHTIWMNVKNVWIMADVVFSYDLAPGAHQMVGQIGFFDKFKIKFDYNESKLTLQQR